MTVLVAGTDCGAVAEQASKVANVDKVLYCDEAGLGNGLAENMSKAVAAAVAAGGLLFLSAYSRTELFLHRVSSLICQFNIYDFNVILPIIRSCCFF